jgi:hypothetical protein
MNKIRVSFPVCKYYGSAIHNIAQSFKEYSPTSLVEFTDDWLNADLVVESLIGTSLFKQAGRQLVHPSEIEFSDETLNRYEMSKLGFFDLSYILHGSSINDEFYNNICNQAIVLTGFENLENILKRKLDKYHRISWGQNCWEWLVESKKFEKEFLIYSWNCSSEPEDEYTESVYRACKRAGGKMLHSGNNYKFDSGEHYVYLPPVNSKEEIRERYAKCWFANSLRREPGFELSAIEAPLANCKPISLDTSHYRYFFNDTSLFVSPNNLVDDLVSIFRRKEEYGRVNIELKRETIEKFNWQTSTKPFWQSIIKHFESKQRVESI